MAEIGPAEAIFAAPAHPYTRALLSAIPEPDPVIARQASRIRLGGEPPSPLDPPPGCLFHTRCPKSDGTTCHTVPPHLTEKRPHQRAACHHPEPVPRNGERPGRPPRRFRPAGNPARTGSARRCRS
ncbi:oligopeptide/dipeptide ABC transporter ATP-binding protein [Roseomonas sp. BN140053]|uniref:oligopeptide/dipeptide ABC transporter ATP-binding protein n=1 Tax=Roseomonas sp. BN140053 TaxID=3391898 RepID=UPI0039E7CB6F